VTAVALGSGLLGFASGFLALMLHEAVALGFCSTRGIAQAQCHGDWSDALGSALQALCAALAASLTLAACFKLAPSHQRAVLGVVFLIGVVYAVALGTEFRAPSAMWGAIVGGGLEAFVLLGKSANRALPNTSLERTREG
jgi:hypothetical protein